MYAFGVKFGMWTNGRVILAALDTSYWHRGRKINQLTFSRVQDISDANHIHQGVAGLCFASIEHKLSQNPQVFMDTLCPPQWRRAPA